MENRSPRAGLRVAGVACGPAGAPGVTPGGPVLLYRAAGTSPAPAPGTQHRRHGLPAALPAPDAELIDVAGIPVLAVKRYDRQDAPAGDIPVRVHQEDGCQATATPPWLKYEEQGGPALRDLADVIRNFGDPRDVTHLLRRTTFNMAVGNADAKNFSVLHELDDPIIGLAPLYDVLSTIALELTDDAGRPTQADTHLGQRVGGQADIRKVSAASLIDEGVSWGIRRRTASAVVTETLDLVLAIPATPGDAWVLAVIREQAERLSCGSRTSSR